MTDNYIKVLKQLYARRRDYLFPSSLLDSLNDDERKDIEEKIVELILLGDKATFKYLKSLKYIDLEKAFTVDKVNHLLNDKKILLLSELYSLTTKNYYLYSLVDLSNNDFDAYECVTMLYNDLTELEKNQIYNKLENLSSKNNQYKNAFLEYVKGEDLLKNKITYSKVKSGVIGFAVGDALGVPIEFTSRESHINNPLTEMKGYGTYHVPEGTWSDDTSMTIAAMDSIERLNGNIDYDDIMTCFCDWAGKAQYTATGKLFDIGIGTRNALSLFYNRRIPAIQCGGKDINNNGNGSLMRMLPIVYYLFQNKIEEKECVSIIKNYSSMTHGHEISQLGCNIYYDYMKLLLTGMNSKEAFDKLRENDYSKYYSSNTIACYRRILDGSLYNEPVNKISSSGYVVHTLEASMWSLLNTDSYEDAVIKAVNLGEDTDTVGAITGSLAGTVYGYKSIPVRWLDKLQNKYLLEKISRKYSRKLTIKPKISSRFYDDYDFLPDDKKR